MIIRMTLIHIYFNEWWTMAGYDDHHQLKNIYLLLFVPIIGCGSKFWMERKAALCSNSVPELCLTLLCIPSACLLKALKVLFQPCSVLGRTYWNNLGARWLLSDCSPCVAIIITIVYVCCMFGAFFVFVFVPNTHRYIDWHLWPYSGWAFKFLDISCNT